MTLNDYQTRDRTSFLYVKEITKPWGGLDLVLAWCRTELTGEWRWQLMHPSSDSAPGRYAFYFDSDRDMCAFTMTWQ